MSILLKNGSVYVDGAFRTCDVLIDGDTIAAVGENLICAGAEVIDCTGKTVLPGLVDLHVHLREPGFAYKETVASGTAAAAAGGYTTVCPMPNLNPVPDSREHLQLQLDAIERDAIIRVFPFGAITVGEKGKELSDITGMAKSCIGFSDDGKGVQSEEMMRQAMTLVKNAGSFISAHCEDESLLEGGAIHKGEYAALHGMRGISSASEYVPIERDIRLAAETGVQYHVCHISAKESIEAVRRGKAAGVRVTCEVTPHHIALTDMDITEDDGRFKMNPPLRGREDREAIWAGLQDGTIDCIATDHAPHSAEEKGRGLEKSAFGTVGSETAFAVCYTHLVRTGVLNLEKLAHLMSSAPAAIIGRRAEIAVGEAADIAVFDLTEQFTVDPDQFVSMGKSSPFTGQELYGTTELTVCAGNIVYRRR
ncbi:MAG: dihydroorotase [Ruminococcaceae bacterium]|nr:dihydroorotase [Oscillospiraceae bacterium]